MVDRQGASSRGGGRKRPRVAAASAAPAAADGAAAVAVATNPFQQHEKYHVYQSGNDGNDDGEEQEENDDEEARIRALVFGKGESGLLSAFGAEADREGGSAGAGRKAEFNGGFYEDLEGDANTVVGDGGAAAVAESVVVVDGGKKKGGPAWVDEDDASLKVDITAKNRLKKLRKDRQEADLAGPEFEQRLRSRFESSNMTVDWVKSATAAKIKKVSKQRRGAQGGSYSSGDDDGSDGEGFGEEDEGGALLRNSAALKGGSGGVLEPGYLNIVRCKDANQHDPAKAAVRAVSFHPTGELLLAGGFDKTLRLFQVDGVRNAKVHSIFFEDLPITSAAFTGVDEAIVTGRRSFFYSYDVATGKVMKVPRIFSSGRAEKHVETFAASPDGRWLAFIGSGGYVLLLSSKTKQWAADFKLNSTATAVSFSPDSRYVLASSADADVYKFDIRSRRCVSRFFNEGGTSTTSMSATGSTSSSPQRLTAVGSESGVVNVYDADALETGKRVLRPSPLKAVMSLTTPVTTTKFSPDGQMLAIASNQKRDALKVIHSASCTPFTNWPTERTPIRYPFALDFSPGGGFLAVGNDRGCVLLYRIRHYPQA
ncbi:unnamed protein product [Pylaiella littoralis]